MITITKPTGEQIRIDGTKIYRSIGSSNPPESWEEDPVTRCSLDEPVPLFLLISGHFFDLFKSSYNPTNR